MQPGGPHVHDLEAGYFIPPDWAQALEQTNIRADYSRPNMSSVHRSVDE